MYSDNRAQTQKDWGISSLCRKTVESVLASPTMLVRALVYNSPYIGPGLAAASAMDVADSMNTKVGATLEEMSIASQALSSTASAYTRLSDELLLRVDMALSGISKID